MHLCMTAHLCAGLQCAHKDIAEHITCAARQVKQVLEAGPDEADQVGLSEFAKLEAQLSN